jgi:hypothetical protein
LFEGGGGGSAAVKLVDNLTKKGEPVVCLMGVLQRSWRKKERKMAWPHQEAMYPPWPLLERGCQDSNH